MTIITLDHTEPSLQLEFISTLKPALTFVQKCFSANKKLGTHFCCFQNIYLENSMQQTGGGVINGAVGCRSAVSFLSWPESE